MSGSGLPAYRAISAICAALNVVLVFALIRRLSGQGPALIAPLLVATSVPFWATATTGRFYAPFFLLYLATLLSLQSSLVLVFIAALLCRLTHELAFTLAAIPLLCAIVDRDRRRRWLLSTMAVVAGLVIGQVVLLALHYFAPSSGETMVRRFFLWQVLNLFERPGDRQFAIPIVVIAIAWIIAPARARLVSVLALSLSAMILTYSISGATNSAPLSRQLVQAIFVEGSRYPLDMFWHVARTTPLTLIVAIVGLVTRVAGLGGTWPRSERALHLLWIGWVLWFGVIDSGITTNYLLLPVSFMLMAIAVDVHAVLSGAGAPARRYFSAPKRAAVAAVIALAAQVAHDQWRGADSIVARLEAARPTIDVPEIAGIRDTLQASDRVVCTDELGCLLLLGRIDRWLALDDFVRERFTSSPRRRAGVRGVYGSDGGVSARRPVCG
ncbi:MAG: glycosyltransferase family 39 protein [Hymenobacter sp.]